MENMGQWHNNQEKQPVQPDQQVPAEKAPAAEIKDYTANPRVREHMANRERVLAAMDQALTSMIMDLSTREQMPSFKKAEQLFDAGYRLIETDGGSGRFLLEHEGAETEHSYSELTGDEDAPLSPLAQAMGIENQEDVSSTATYLMELTEEDKIIRMENEFKTLEAKLGSD